MQDLLRAGSGLESFYGMMSYHLGWVDAGFEPREARMGKCLRPSLCMLIGEGLGAHTNNLAHFAAGLELLHNFSLVHDDIEDRSHVRRNRQTVWSIWGEPQAINAGDGMLSLAHLAWLQSPTAETDPSTFIAALRSAESTILRLCEGQFLDMNAERSLDMSTSAYLKMIGRKTAGLIGEAAWLGARTANVAAPLQEATRAFGIDLGIAFQIRDDILGIWGDEKETGKSASSDIATRKMTLPIIVALESAPSSIREELRARYAEAPEAGDERRVRDLLDAAGARQTTVAQEDQHWHAAMKSLEMLPLSTSWREDVREFARSFVGRSA
jgi:geranylgeranyl diphosphate synthase type I